TGFSRDWSSDVCSSDLRDLGLELDDGVMAQLASVGFDPVYGARPLKRAIQQLIENPLAQDILAGKFLPGSIIHGKLLGEKIVFRSEERRVGKECRPRG